MNINIINFVNDSRVGSGRSYEVFEVETRIFEH